MKKNFKKKIVLIFLLVIIASIVYTNVFNQAVFSKKNNANNVLIIDEMFENNNFIASLEKELKNEYGGNYKEIIYKNSISVEKANELESLFTTSKNGDKIYPDYFGGVYIDKNQNLVVQIVPEKSNSILKSKNETLSLFNKKINNDENILVKNVKHSYAELLEIQDKIKNYFMSNDNDNILAFYIDVEVNKIIVELKSNSKDKIAEFKENVVNSDLISFIKGEMVVGSLNPGEALLRYGTDKFCSMGYRAKRDGKIGFITAGHCVNKNEVIYEGTVRESILEGAVDAAFVESSKNLTNNLNWQINPQTTLKTTDSWPYLVTGQLIGKVGFRTQAQTGGITSMSWSGKVTYNGKIKNMVDLIRSDALNGPGDSGGIVFTFNRYGNSNASVIGIISAGANSDVPQKMTYFSRADKIKAALNTTRY